MAGPNRHARTRDMVISMAVIVIPVLLIMWIFTNPADEGVDRVDVAEVMSHAQEQSSYPLLVADGLDEDWSPTRAAWALSGDPWITSEPAVGDSWQVGYLSPDEVYFGVQQRDESRAEFVRSTTRDGSVVGEPVEIAGITWERYESADERTRSLVAEDGDVTSIVSADTDFVSLEAFAAMLVEVAPTSQ